MERDMEIVKKVYKSLFKDFDKFCLIIISGCTEFNRGLLNFIEEYRKYGILAFDHTQFINDACFFFKDEIQEEAIKTIEKTVVYTVTEEVNSESCNVRNIWS